MSNPAPTDDTEPLPRSDNHADLCEGTAVTVCCGAYATFHDTDLCCKKCWRTVGTNQEST